MAPSPSQQHYDELTHTLWLVGWTWRMEVGEVPPSLRGEGHRQERMRTLRQDRRRGELVERWALPASCFCLLLPKLD